MRFFVECETNLQNMKRFECISENRHNKLKRTPDLNADFMSKNLIILKNEFV